jgi:hypothetical protein
VNAITPLLVATTALAVASCAAKDTVSSNPSDIGRPEITVNASDTACT